MKKSSFLLLLMVVACAEDRPFLSGYIKQAYDAALVPCDPYNKNVTHSCLVFASANQGQLYIYDASAQEMVLAPIGYRPLMVNVGQKTADTLAGVAGMENSPWLFALDGNEANLYAVRMFPSAEKKEKSLVNPKAQKLDVQPKKMAAALHKDKILAVFTLPNLGQVQVLAIDKDTGIIDESLKPKTFAIGTKPSHVGIIDEQVVISDEGSNNLYSLKLSEIFAHLTGGAAPVPENIDIGMASDKLFLANQDLGAGLKPYGIVFEAFGQKLGLISLSDKLHKNISLEEYPMAAYFPENSQKFKDADHWFSVATVKGTLKHFSINQSLEMNELSSIDLLAKENLDLSTLQVKKILGGAIISDNKKRNKTCPNNRQVFWVASGNTKSYFGLDSLEVEAHSYACESEQTATRLGQKSL